MAKRRTIFKTPYEFLWSGKITMPVQFPFGENEWTGVYGLQIGNCFIGVILGTPLRKEHS